MDTPWPPIYVTLARHYCIYLCLVLSGSLDLVVVGFIGEFVSFSWPIWLLFPVSGSTFQKFLFDTDPGVACELTTQRSQRSYLSRLDMLSPSPMITVLDSPPSTLATLMSPTHVQHQGSIVPQPANGCPIFHHIESWIFSSCNELYASPL